MSLRIQIFVLTAVLVLSFASFTIARVYSPSLAFKIGIPAVVVTGWAFFGHLITLDDDAPDGFSNPQRSSRFWHSSLLELLLKGGLFLLVCFLVFSGQ
jgi:hypothetical protein